MYIVWMLNGNLDIELFLLTNLSDHLPYIMIAELSVFRVQEKTRRQKLLKNLSEK